MHRKEVNERSPLRLLEKSIHGGLGRGNLGVVAARHGVGKTAFLVGIALDDLMRGRKVLHVCLDHSMEKARSFYDDIFMDLAHAQQLEDVWGVRVELERNRRIYAFDNETFSIAKLERALGFMREHEDFAPVAIVVDGYDFDRMTVDDLTALRRIAGEADAELWMSAVSFRDRSLSPRGVPDPLARFEDKVDVILTMAHDGKQIHVGLLKDHDNPDVSDLRLALDPTTMLLVREG